MMKAELSESGGAGQHLLAIAAIREKVILLNKCRRKMEMSAMDAESLEILMAAHEQLTREINSLCHEVGL